MPLIEAVASGAFGVAEVSWTDIESAIGIGICIAVESAGAFVFGRATVVSLRGAMGGRFAAGRVALPVTAPFFAGDFAFFVLSLVPIGMFMGIGCDFFRAESARAESAA